MAVIKWLREMISIIGTPEGHDAPENPRQAMNKWRRVAQGRGAKAVSAAWTLLERGTPDCAWWGWLAVMRPEDAG